MRLTLLITAVLGASLAHAAPSADDYKALIVESFRTCGTSSDYWEEQGVGKVSTTKERITTLVFEDKVAKIDEAVETKFMGDARGKGRSFDVDRWQVRIDLSQLSDRVKLDQDIVTVACKRASGNCIKVVKVSGEKREEADFARRDLYLCQADTADRVARSLTRLIRHYGD